MFNKITLLISMLFTSLDNVISTTGISTLVPVVVVGGFLTGLCIGYIISPEPIDPHSVAVSMLKDTGMFVLRLLVPNAFLDSLNHDLRIYKGVKHPLNTVISHSEKRMRVIHEDLRFDTINVGSQNETHVDAWSENSILDRDSFRTILDHKTWYETHQRISLTWPIFKYTLILCLIGFSYNNVPVETNSLWSALASIESIFVTEYAAYTHKVGAMALTVQNQELMDFFLPYREFYEFHMSEEFFKRLHQLDPADPTTIPIIRNLFIEGLMDNTDFIGGGPSVLNPFLTNPEAVNNFFGSPQWVSYSDYMQHPLKYNETVYSDMLSSVVTATDLEWSELKSDLDFYVSGDEKCKTYVGYWDVALKESL